VGWEEGWYLPGGFSLKGRRLGVFQPLLESDSLYRATTEQLKKAGAEIVAFTPPEVELEGFLTLLNIDMKQDLPKYLRTQIADTIAVQVRSVADVVAFNEKDSLIRMPYGQARLEGILADTTSVETLDEVRSALIKTGRAYLGEPLKAHQLDAILSVNNRHASYAAVAKYPALTVPMGYRDTGEPVGLTIIVKPFQIPEMLDMAHAVEQLLTARRIPEAYRE
jgi:amidase